MAFGVPVTSSGVAEEEVSHYAGARSFAVFAKGGTCSAEFPFFRNSAAFSLWVHCPAGCGNDIPGAAGNAMLRKIFQEPFACRCHTVR